MLLGNRDNSPNNLVRRMTDILTRMLFRPSGRPSSFQSSSESSPLASSHSEDGDVDVVSDSNIDDAGIVTVTFHSYDTSMCNMLFLWFCFY